MAVALVYQPPATKSHMINDCYEISQVGCVSCGRFCSCRAWEVHWHKGYFKDTRVLAEPKCLGQREFRPHKMALYWHDVSEAICAPSPPNVGVCAPETARLWCLMNSLLPGQSAWYLARRLVRRLVMLLVFRSQYIASLSTVTYAFVPAPSPGYRRCSIV